MLVSRVTKGYDLLWLVGVVKGRIYRLPILVMRLEDVEAPGGV